MFLGPVDGRRQKSMEVQFVFAFDMQINSQRFYCSGGGKAGAKSGEDGVAISCFISAVLFVQSK